jgi:hypothetical protein
VVALAAFGASVAGLVLLLGEALALWISAFVVAAALAVTAGFMALMGKKNVTQAIPPKPEAAIENVQADMAEIKERAKR